MINNKSLRKALIRFTPSALVDFEYPDPSRVLGLSTSHWTGIVNWKVAREAGIKFAYIKAQNGVNNPTRFWKENYEGARKEDIKVGGYTWLYPASVASPGTQARKLVEMAKIYPTDLPWCVDFEWTSPSNPNTGDLWGFVKPFTDEHGHQPAIYTAPGYWNEYGSVSPVWSAFPLWQAQYKKGNADIIKPWMNGYTFLQWTERGKGIDYGVPTSGEIACELNYYRGTLAQFEAEYGDTPPVEPPPDTGDNMITGTVLAGALNIRPSAGTTQTAIGQLVKDDIVEAASRNLGWWQLTKITRAGVNVPLPAVICYAYEGVNNGYIRLDSEVTPPSSNTYTATIKEDTTNEVWSGVLTKQ
jgi:lysozyme